MMVGVKLTMNTFTTISRAKKDSGLSYLGSVSASSKVSKNEKVLGIDTYVMYLAPSTMSGHNVCSMATTECIKGCLNTSGRAKMQRSHDIMMASRIKKTNLFYSDRQYFNDWLFAEIAAAKRKSITKGNEFAVRLNGTSDLSPILFKNHTGINILNEYPDIQFYDYSKVLNRTKLVDQHPNYSLTFSYTGYNWEECMKALDNGVNVAVVFANDLPEYFHGWPVIDGDIHDYRPLDKRGSIVGLRWKKIKNKEINDEIRNSKFVVK